VDIGSDRSLVRGASSLFLSGGHAALAQHNERVFDISLGLLQSLEAITHGRARFLAEILYQFCIYLFCHSHSRFLLGTCGAANRAFRRITLIRIHREKAWLLSVRPRFSKFT